MNSLVVSRLKYFAKVKAGLRWTQATMLFQIFLNRHLMKSSPFPLQAAAGTLAITLICVPDSQAQQADAASAPLLRENAAVHVGVERIKLPGNEEMGMLGTSYLIEVAPSLYFGP